MNYSVCFPIAFTVLVFLLARWQSNATNSLLRIKQPVTALDWVKFIACTVLYQTIAAMVTLFAWYMWMNVQ